MRTLRWWISLAVFLLPGLTVRADGLPDLGEIERRGLSVNAERRLGERIMVEIRRDPAYLDDPVLLDYLHSVWQPLVKAGRDRGDIGADMDAVYPFEAFLVRELGR